MSEPVATNQTNALRLTWKHGLEDHVIMIAYQLFKSREGTFAKQAKKRKVVINLIFVLFVGGIWSLSEGWIGFAAGVISMLTVYGLFWLITKFIGGGYASNNKTTALARRYVNALGMKPLGTYHLTLTDRFLTFHWVEGEQTTTFPTRRIGQVEEYKGRLFMLERGEPLGSVPIHALGDRQTKDWFCTLVLNTTPQGDTP